MQQARVASTLRKKNSGRVGCTFGKDETIENGIYDIAQGTGEYHRKGNEEAFGCFEPDQMAQVEANAYNGSNPDGAKQNLTKSTREAQAEGHAIVFHKVKTGPLSQEGNLLVEGHIGFDQNLEGLVGQQNQQNNQYGSAGCYLFFFASMHRVACGTARRRSFEISLPVSLQTP